MHGLSLSLSLLYSIYVYIYTVYRREREREIEKGLGVLQREAGTVARSMSFHTSRGLVTFNLINDFHMQALTYLTLLSDVHKFHLENSTMGSSSHYSCRTA